MSENRNSIFYPLAVGLSLAVFAFIGIGLFLPLVKINGGESISIFKTVQAIIQFFVDIKNIDIDKIVKIVELVRNTVVTSLALMLLIRLLIGFIKYIVKNFRNIFHPNDFYGEDMISICVEVAFFSMMMYAYFPKWDYDIGLAFMNIAALVGIGIVSFLRVVEGLKSDHPWKGLLHAVLMFGAAIFVFLTISVGMHSPVVVEGTNVRVAIIEEFTTYFTYTFTNFSKESIISFLLMLAALFLIFASFRYLGTVIQYVLGCVTKTRRGRKQHEQKEYHFKAILRLLLGIFFFAGAIIIIILKSPEAFGVKYTIGRTAIVSFILLGISLILIIVAKIIRPEVNTYEKATAKQEAYEQEIEAKVKEE